MRPFLVRMLTASTVEREEMLSVKNNSVSKKKSRLPLALLPTSVGLLFISSQWSNTYVGQRQNGLKCEKDWQKGDQEKYLRPEGTPDHQ